MLKKIILLVCLIVPMTMVAQDKIAHISSQELLFLMPEVKDVEAKLALKREELNKTIQDLGTQYQAQAEVLQKKWESFQKDSTSVSEGDLQDAQKVLSQIEERIQTRRETAEADFEKYYRTLMEPIQQKLQKAISEVGDEQGYKYIFEKSAVLYAGSTAIDASKLVAAKLGITL